MMAAQPGNPAFVSVFHRPMIARTANTRATIHMTNRKAAAAPHLHCSCSYNPFLFPPRPRCSFKDPLLCSLPVVHILHAHCRSKADASLRRYRDGPGGGSSVSRTGRGQAASAGPSAGDGLVLRSAETEHQIHDRCDEPQQDPEAGAMAEVPRDVEAHEQQDDDVDDRDEIQDQPPAGAPRDLDEEVDVVDRNDGSPARLAGLSEGPPQFVVSTITSPVLCPTGGMDACSLPAALYLHPCIGPAIGVVRPILDFAPSPACLLPTAGCMRHPSRDAGRVSYHLTGGTRIAVCQSQGSALDRRPRRDAGPERGAHCLPFRGLRRRRRRE